MCEKQQPTTIGFSERLPTEGKGTLNAESRYVTSKGSASLNLLRRTPLKWFHN